MLKIITAALAILAAAPLAAAGLTAATLAGLERVYDPRASPDGHQVLYGQRTTDWDANKGVHAVWIVDAAGRTPARRLIAPPAGATSARWLTDGRSILFITADPAGVDQVWRAPVCASTCTAADLTQITRLPLDVGAFRVAGGRLIVAIAVFPDCADLACTMARLAARKAEPASGIVYDKLFVRHWDSWADGRRNHLFSVAADGATATDLMPGFDGDAPSKPFGDDSDFAVTANSVIFSARVAGTGEPWSTNFDVFEVPLAGGTPRNLTAANPAWDAGPVVSPDGRSLAYRAMCRPGFEADRFAVMVMDRASGQTREVNVGFDRSAEGLAWSADGRSLVFSAEDIGQRRLFAVDVAGGKVRPLTGAGAVGDFRVAGTALIYASESLTAPAQLFRISAGTAPIQLTRANADTLAATTMGAPEQITFKGWNGETVHGYLVRPANFDPAKRYPVAFLIHGGPQGSFGNFWSYRWNPQFYAGLGFAVVMIDFHGSTSYGQAFTDAISEHWGDRPLEDLQKGWAAVLDRYKFLDGNRACALGASYGGFMVNWIAAKWNTPWRCLVSHDGVFDNRTMGFTTEELWFTEWENGGAPWANPASYERFNPSSHVAEWSKPMLVIHGGKDFRIPLEQGLGAFTALQRRGIGSRFLYFGDENHWVLKPRNSVQWHDTVGGWITQWTK